MKTILVPTDFSENAVIAADYAAQLARDFDASLILLNTYNLQYTDSGIVGEFSKDLDAISQKGLEAEQSRIHKKYGVTAEIFSRCGGLVEMVSDMESVRDIDMIVMVTHGASGVDEILLGTNTADVVKLTKSPVLVLPMEVKYVKPENVVYSCDFQKIKKLNELHPLKEMLRKYQSSMDIVRVIKEEESREAGQDFDVMGIVYHDWLKDIDHHFHYVKNDDVEDGLHHFMEGHKTDMMAVFARKHSLLESLLRKSISKNLTFHTEIPLLVLKEQ